MSSSPQKINQIISYSFTFALLAFALGFAFFSWRELNKIDHFENLPRSQSVVSNNSKKPVELKTNILVDAGKESPLPAVLKLGFDLNHPDRHAYVIDKLLSENTIGRVKISKPVSESLINSKNFEDYKQRLAVAFAPGNENKKIIEKFQKAGATIFITHWPTPIPDWLTSQKDNRQYALNSCFVSAVSAPVCYGYECDLPQTELNSATATDEKIAQETKIQGWSAIIDHTLRFFFHDLGVKKLGYSFGGAPDKDWLGSELELYELYKATSQATKKVDESILVGGIGASSYDAKRIRCEESHLNAIGAKYCGQAAGWSMDNWKNPLNKNFIHYARENNLPLDFLSYQNKAKSPSQIKNEAKILKNWLAEKGYSDTLLYPDYWSYWSDSFAYSKKLSNYPFDSLDTQEASSYAIAALLTMKEAGITIQNHLFDAANNEAEEKIIEKRLNGEFIGDWPIFTRSQIIKPIYNAFRAISQVNDKSSLELVSKIENNEFLSSLASIRENNKSLRILISNFIPTGEMLSQYLANKFNRSPSAQSTLEYQEKVRKCIQEQNDKFHLSALEKKNESMPTRKKIIETCLDPLIITIEDRQIRKRLRDQIKLSACRDFNQESAVWQFQCFDDSLNSSQDELFTKDLETIINDYKKITKLAVNPKKFDLDIANLPKGEEVNIKIYKIDQNNANSCALNKNTENKETQSECGVLGQVDLEAQKALTEAKKAAFEITQELISSLTLEESIAEKTALCLDKAKIKTCLDELSANLCQEDKSLDCKNLEKKLENVYKKYETIYNNLLFGGSYEEGEDFVKISTYIDKINNAPNVSLEGSAQEEKVFISNNEYKKELEIEPFGVMLIDLSF